MKIIDNEIWLEVTDWESVGYKFETLKSNISRGREFWSSITTQNTGNATLYLYDSLSPKHSALFAASAKAFRIRFEQTQIAETVLADSTAAKTNLQIIENQILEMIAVNPADVAYFQSLGFVAENTYKSTLYARRAAWLKMLSSIRPVSIKMMFAHLDKNLTTKTDFYKVALVVLHADDCFGFRTPNLQYLKMLLVKWNKEGLSSCVDARNGKQNALKITPDTEKLLISVMCGLHKPTAMQVLETYTAFLAGNLEITSTQTGEVFAAAAYKALSYASIQQLMLKPLFQATYDAVHGSNLTYRAKHGLYLKRNRPDFFGSMITCDDWDLPVDISSKMLSKMLGKGEKTPKLKAYLFLDCATRHCVGYGWSFNKDAALFLSGLINMLQNPVFAGKMPYELQTEKNIISSLQKSGELQNGELFSEVTVLPKNPMGKYAESDIRNIKYQILAKHPKYAHYFKGRHYAKREAQRLEKDDQNKVLRLSVEEIPDFLADIIGKWNVLHPATGETGNIVLHADLKEQPLERMAFYLGETVKTSYHNGKFKAKNKEWRFENIDYVLSRLENNQLVVKFWDNVPYVYQNSENALVFITVASEVIAVQASKLEATAEDTKNRQTHYANQANLDKKVAKQAAKAEKMQIIEKILAETVAKAVVATPAKVIPMPIATAMRAVVEEKEEEDFYTKYGKAYLANKVG